MTDTNSTPNPGDLIDVSGMTLAEVETIEPLVLRRALRRLLESDEEETGPIAGFSQHINGASDGGHPG